MSDALWKILEIIFTGSPSTFGNICEIKSITINLISQYSSSTFAIFVKSVDNMIFQGVIKVVFDPKNPFSMGGRVLIKDI